MNWNNRFIVRRTISQERFEVLWKKRMEDELTLKELTEMEEIINRDPVVFQFVLKEMQNLGSTHEDDGQNIFPPTFPPVQTLADKIRSFFKRLITFSIIESGRLVAAAN